MKQKKRNLFKIVQYVRTDTGVVHPELTYREALDQQASLTKAAGSQRPMYMYKIEDIS
tara:strand:- start:900 stop:1073 length:174 start_codon:yes stop_codon:yes gene_type:complete